MKQSNRMKVSGLTIALGICASAALYQPAIARQAGENGADAPHAPNPSAHKPGGQNPGGDQNHDGGPPMRPEEMLTQQLELTPQQQAKVQAIFEQEREQMRLIHEKTRSNIQAILTAEQKTKFEKMPMRGPGVHGPRGPQDGNRPPAPGEMQDKDHGRPVELIAKDLGVTPEQFREAFKKVRPARRGERPTEEQLHSNHKILAEALGVSIEKLDAVMDKYRPEGPDARPRMEQE